MTKKKKTTYLPKVKLMGRSKANKSICKDGLAVPFFIFFNYSFFFFKSTALQKLFFQCIYSNPVVYNPHI